MVQFGADLGEEFDDYPVRFTRSEKAQLREAFPKGVCDYTRPGPGQQERPRTWIDYSRR